MPTAAPSPIDADKLDKLAQVAIKVGLRLEKGQDLVLTGPVAALPLVRRIAAHAYEAGAGLVTTLFSDEELTLARYRKAPDESFDKAARVQVNREIAAEVRTLCDRFPAPGLAPV